MPNCAAQILCAINQRSPSQEVGPVADTAFRASLTKVASFPAAWAISNKSGQSFWTLYAAILETDNCMVSPPRNYP